MPITAKISSSYRWRIGIIGLGLLAFAGWFIYDWQFSYPATREKQLTAQRIFQNEELSLQERQAKWLETAEARGWSEERPGEPMSKADVNTQLWYGLPCLVLSIPVLVTFLMMGRRYVAADEESVYDHRGRRATWDQINDIDKSRWDTKGIAAIHYRDSTSDQPKKLILDDWKYDRDPTQQILQHVESRVYPDQTSEEQAQPEATTGETTSGAP